MLAYKKDNSTPNESCKSQVIADALEAWRKIQQEAERNGLSEMTLEEINMEIYLARREREAKEARMRLVGC